MPDFAAMTDDELQAYKDEWDVVRLDAHTKLLEAQEEHNARVARWHLNEAKTQLSIASERSGRNMVEQAKFWVYDENADDHGHRIQGTMYLRSEGII